MPPNTARDAIVIALDVGKSVTPVHDYEEKSFLEQAKDCVSWIIQRKIISQSVDVLSLLLIGSDEASISSAPKSYQYISEKFDFQLASWDMLKFIIKELKPTDIEADWSKALMVSVEMLKAYEEFNLVRSKKIVIFSDFSLPCSVNFDSIIQSIKNLNIEVTIIGPDHLSILEDYDDAVQPENKKKKTDKSLGRQKGEKIVYNLSKKLPEHIGICTFESALKQLCSYTPKSRKTNCWNCMMDIGEININISMVKKTDPKQPRKFDTKCFKGNEYVCQSTSAENVMVKSEETTSVIKDKVMHYKHGVGEDNEIHDVEVKPEDTIEGFRYGMTVIPFSEEDKTAMQYKPGSKSFSVIGFTHISNVPYYLLSGDCSYIVMPRKEDKNAEVALSAIIQGMKKMECLAIARKVSFDNCGLALGILYPTIEEIFSDETDEVLYKEYLLFVELAFEDDVKSIDFPSLLHAANQITRKQYDAVDDLIDKMNLMKADKGLRGEPCEAFDLPFLHDFKEQFFQHCVIQRGLYPEKPLPTAIPHYIKNLIDVPPCVEENCKPVFKEIKKLFKIEKLEDDSIDQWSKEKLSKQSDRLDKNQENVQSIFEHFPESIIGEETNPFIRSWMRLFQKNFPTDNELEEFFIKLINANECEKSEALAGFKVIITKIRAMYCKSNRNPESYNQWVKTFKKYLDCNTGIFGKIWKIIITENFGLITNQENLQSNVTNEEANEFLRMDLIKPPDENKEKPNFDLLDELQEEQMNLESAML